MSQTMLAEKLQRSGFIPREVRFTVAIARALNVGGITGLRHFLDGIEEFQLEHGTIERARELLAVAADKMGGGGQASGAEKAIMGTPPASQPHGDEGQAMVAGKAIAAVPSSPPKDSAAGHTGNVDGHPILARPLSPDSHREGSGHIENVQKGQVGTAAPPREPSALDRAAAIKAARTSAVAVLTIFDRRLLNGRPLGKHRFHELAKGAAENESEAMARRYMVAEVNRIVANPNGMALVRDIVPQEVAERAFAFARVVEKTTPIAKVTHAKES